MHALSMTTQAGVLACALSLPALPVLAQSEAVCPDTELRVVMLGDSLADGLWGSLYRTYARCQTVDVVRLTEVSDGLAKTADNEWLARYIENANGRDTKVTDVVVVQIGANDITTIRNGATRESFATDVWNAMYSKRVDGLATGLRDRAAALFWVGLPIVGNSEYEGPYQSISKMQAEVIEVAGGTFYDIHEHTMFGSEAFSMNGEFEGDLQKLRADDQIHFTTSGYDYVAGAFMKDLVALLSDLDRRAALQDVQLQ